MAKNSEQPPQLVDSDGKEVPPPPLVDSVKLAETKKEETAPEVEVEAQETEEDLKVQLQQIEKDIDDIKIDSTAKHSKLVDLKTDLRDLLKDIVEAEEDKRLLDKIKVDLNNSKGFVAKAKAMLKGDFTESDYRKELEKKEEEFRVKYENFTVERALDGYREKKPVQEAKIRAAEEAYEEALRKAQIKAKPLEDQASAIRKKIKELKGGPK